MGTEERGMLPIAPASSIGSPRPRFSHAADSASSGTAVPAVKEKPKGLTVSRQWVLPQRPKPGRKPKPKPPKAVAQVKSPSEASDTRARDGTPSTPQSLPSGTHSPQGGLNSPHNGAHGAQNGSAHHHHSSHKQDDESCGLCSRDDCMCETIGLKSSTQSPPERKKSLPTLDMILNSAPPKMDAVPLKRPFTGNGDAPTAKKPAKSSVLRPLHPKHILNVPSPLEGLQVTPEGCGFCTENSFCACSEAEKATQASPAPAPAPAQGHTRAAPTAPGPVQTPSVGPMGIQGYMVPPMHAVAIPHSYEMHMPSSGTQPGVAENACQTCEKDAMSMLFCLSLSSSSPLAMGAVSIPCYLAFRTLKKHPKFEGCDLGRLVRRLEVNSGKQVGVQSINRALQDLERGEFT